MAKTASGLVIPEPREFSYQAGDSRVAYRMSSGKAMEGGRPKVCVNRYAAQDLLAKQGYTLPRFRQSWNAIQNDTTGHMRGSVLTFPTEWQLELILGSGTQTERRGSYTLLDASGNPLVVSNQARVLVPISIEGKTTKTIKAEVYDIKDFEAGEKCYNPENPETWDPQTGFFDFKGGFTKSGKYAFFPKGEGLYAARLSCRGYASCIWSPEYSSGDLGFRGVINSSSEQVKLVEPVVIEVRGSAEQKRPKRNPIIAEVLGKIEARYISQIREAEAGLAELEELRHLLEEEA